VYHPAIRTVHCCHAELAAGAEAPGGEAKHPDAERKGGESIGSSAEPMDESRNRRVIGREA